MAAGLRPAAMLNHDPLRSGIRDSIKSKHALAACMIDQARRCQHVGVARPGRLGHMRVFHIMQENDSDVA
jgi:hypothetical protein